MRTVRFLFVSIFVFAIFFKANAQEKNNVSLKTYSSKNITAKKYPESGLNISSSGIAKNGKKSLSENIPTKSIPIVRMKDQSVSEILFKSLWTGDIPVLESDNPEKNPSLLSLKTQENNPEIILTAEEWDNTNYTNLIFIKSRDHGFSWQRDSILVISDSQSSLTNPKLTQNSDSSFCAVFQRNWDETNQDIYLAIINNDLSSSEIVTVDPTPIRISNPNIVSDYPDNKNNSSVFLVYYQINGLQSTLIFRKSMDGGITWSYFELATINTPENPYCSIAFADGVLGVAFTHKTGVSDDIIGFVSTDKGESWSNFSFLAYSNQHERFPEVAVADSSYIFVIYESWYSDTDRDILYAYTDNAGSNWQINNTLSMGDDDERLPDIKKLPGTPQIYAGYLNFTTNEVLVTNTIYLIPSVWADPFSLKKNLSVLSKQNSVALLPKLSPAGENGVSAAWCQNENNSDIYFNATWGNSVVTISGFVKTGQGIGLSQVVMQGLPNSPVSDSTGFYTDEVASGWSGTVTPQKAGWTFLPSSLAYSNVTVEQSDQNYKASEVTFIISGFVKDSTNTPVENVILRGLPNIPATDSTGFYADSVTYDWTGVVTPEKVGWEFLPKSRIYQNVNSDQNDQAYSAALKKVVISGFVTDSSGNPIDDVKLNGLPHNPITGLDGFYSDSVYFGWSGTVAPTKQGLLFSPQNRVYSKITQDQKEQNYTGSILQYIISGTIFDSENQPNVDVVLNGLPGNPITDSNGFYSVVVPSGWSGNGTPVKEGWEFNPPAKVYSNVISNQVDQNYFSSLIQLTISGTVLTVDSIPMTNILLEGLPNNPFTDLTGFFSDTVFYGWSGIVTPKSSTWQFSPTDRIYADLHENQITQNFIGSTIQFIISGFVKDSLQNPISNVLLNGFPGDIKTDSLGFYSVVIPVNWSGLVTPQKEGWRFVPSSKQYNDIQAGFNEESYNGILRKYIISGFALNNKQEPIVDVLMNGLPGNPVTDINGFFSDSVFFNWSGNIVPQKEGWTFSPLSETFQNIANHQKNRNFVGSEILLTISGFVKDAANNPINGVILQGLPNSPGSDSNGFYSDTLIYNWSGVVTPYKEGWDFSPASKNYNNVISGMNEENFIGTLVSGIQENKNTPETYFLSQNYPNPFSAGRAVFGGNPGTYIEFGIPEITHVSLSIYDLTGREVARLVDKTLNAGFHKIEWKSRNLPSGTYFLMFRTKKFSRVKKLVLLR